MTTAIEQKIPHGTWNVDPSHSSVEFQVKHMAIATVKGFFDEYEGTIEIGDTPGSTKAHGKVKVAASTRARPSGTSICARRISLMRRIIRN